MGLFSKKKEETKSCCCGGKCTPETMAQAEAAKTAAGVMTTPALVVDGKVVSYGKVLKKDEAKALIQKVRT